MTEAARSTVVTIKRDAAVAADDRAHEIFDAMCAHAIEIAKFDESHDLKHDASALFQVTGQLKLMWAIEKLYGATRELARAESTEVTNAG